jgi:uncharacterized iron-regulated membrane protein
VQAARPGAERIRKSQDQWVGLEALLLRAKQHSPAWKSISVRQSPGAGVAFIIDEGSGGQPQRRAQLTLNRKTGEVVRWEPFSANNAGRRLRSWARFVHTGEAGGAIGQTVATIASAGGALLVLTGLALACRRLWAWRSRRAKQRQGELVAAFARSVHAGNEEPLQLVGQAPGPAASPPAGLAHSKQPRQSGEFNSGAAR